MTAAPTSSVPAHAMSSGGAEPEGAAAPASESALASAPAVPAAAQGGGALPGVLGVALYSRTVAAARYAKDADKAPTTVARVSLLRLSAAQVEAIDELDALGDELGVDAVRQAEPFTGALGEFDERLRPQDWSERLVKTYLSMGLLADFCGALARTLPDELAARILDALSRDRFGEVATAQLVSRVSADAQLAARLGLWGRRVLGEEIGTLQRMLARYPGIMAGGTDPEELHEVLSQGAVSRMGELGLRV